MSRLLIVVPLAVWAASTVALMRLGGAAWPPSVAGVLFFALVWLPIGLAASDVAFALLSGRAGGRK